MLRSSLCRARPAVLARPVSGPSQRRHLLTIGIETSCDDTSVAVLETRDHNRRPWPEDESDAVLHFHDKVTANNTSFKGIHPLAALESHHQNIAPLLQRAIRHLPRIEQENPSADSHFVAVPSEDASTVDFRMKPDFIAVTRGPGMMSNLSTGLQTAKGLATAWAIPLVGVHHMHAHALTPRLVSALTNKSDPSGSGPTGQNTRPVEPRFPFISLLVSGGHTLIIRSNSLESHQVLSSTTDRAIGQCLDKAGRLIVPENLVDAWGDTMYARLLERFAFPNGPKDYDYRPPKNRGEELGKRITSWSWGFQPPMGASPAGLRACSMDMSFAGTLSSVENFIRFGMSKETGRVSKMPRAADDVSEEERKCMAREIMRVTFEHLAGRIFLVLQEITETNSELAQTMSVVVSGGVASNMYMRHVLSEFLAYKGYPDIKLLYPPLELCTDNAAMIAWAGIEMFRRGHQTSLACLPIRKWSLEDLRTPPTNSFEGT
ncbi:glycoprotease family protein [Phyllosticta citrichinensis]|uniref:Glycoprotease family protein n=1 Tax=Phyllosticta citrichinensis TaxID=1130410 RepID=A0ABR1XN92_9PEZI